MKSFYINDFNISDKNNNFPTLNDAVTFAQANHEAEGYIWIYQITFNEGDDNGTSVAYQGYVKNLPTTELEQHIMDASTANLGNRFNG